MAELIWETIPSGDEVFLCKRSRVPGGWLVVMGERNYQTNIDRGIGITFVTDPNREWV